MKRFLLAGLSALLLTLPCAGQVLEPFRLVYMIFGVPLQGPVDKTTVNLKFQVSTAIPLWRNIGRKEGLELHLGYTQVSVCDYKDSSSPFRDNNFIPTLYLRVPVQRGRLLIGIEHQSNGRPMRGTQGDPYSRSANYLMGDYRVYLPCGVVLKAVGRFGYGWYGEERTQEVFSRFLGYADLGAGYQSPNGKWELNLDLSPIFGPFDCNINASAAYHLRPFAIFAQFNRGYGECLYDWVRGSRPAPYLRIGLLFGKLL